MNVKKVMVVLLVFSLLASLGGFPEPFGNSMKVSAETISLSGYQVDSRIRMNSVGFLPQNEKLATIGGSCKDFSIAKENGEVVFKGTVTSMQNSDTSEQVYIADFTSVNEEGTYCLVVPGIGKSVNFKISKDVYNDLYKTSMLGMYLWRCGTSVSATYNGINYSHEACHTGDGYLDSITGQHTKKDGTGGWHDAGDYNKYIVNAGITVGSMFMAWEQFGEKLKDIKLTMPQSSNSMPDFLDEMKYEMEWVLKMQYPDGSGKVSHKLTTKAFGGFIMPETESTERFFTPWGTAATADFVAMTAMAGRIFKPYDPDFANKCIEAAKVSYACLKANPSNVKPNQSGYSTGGYDTTDSDDRLWAAAEMWETLGDDEYLKDFENRVSGFKTKILPDFDWSDIQNLGMFTYLNSKRTGKNQSVFDTVKRELISTADSIVSTSNAHGYGRTLGTKYYWGCNGTVARQTMILQLANKFSPKEDYVNTALDAIGHLLGRNYYGRSFVTGVGVNPPKYPHDRRNAAGKGAWPGYLVGGGWPGAKDWEDVEESYETNEIAINWNGGLIYAVAGFVYSPNTNPEPTPQPDVMYGDLNGDKSVDSTDLALIKRFILGIIKTFPDDNGIKAADLNEDGTIDSSDAAILKRYILGILKTLPLQ